MTSRPWSKITTPSTVWGLAEHVAGDKHRPPFGGQIAQQLAKPVNAFGVEPVGGLIEDEDLRFGQQRGSQAKPLAHAEGELPYPPLGRRGQSTRSSTLSILAGLTAPSIAWMRR